MKHLNFPMYNNALTLTKIFLVMDVVAFIVYLVTRSTFVGWFAVPVHLALIFYGWRVLWIWRHVYDISHYEVPISIITNGEEKQEIWTARFVYQEEDQTYHVMFRDWTTNNEDSKWYISSESLTYVLQVAYHIACHSVIIKTMNILTNQLTNNNIPDEQA